MKPPRATAILGVLCLAACSSGPDASSTPRARGEIVNIKITAVVESVDQTTRQITLQGPKGEPETYIAGPEVKRLAEIKAGDKITLDYKVGAMVELREPTESEKHSPMVIAQGADRAPADLPPGGAFARAVRMVALIETIDAATQTFSIRGPLGGMIQVKVEDAQRFASLRVWKAVVVTFVESALLSVEPASK